MSDYISREEAINTIKDRHCEICEHNDHRTNNWHCRNCQYAESMEDIESVPVADVAPVKHGKWIEHKNMEDFCVDFGKGNISLRDMAEVLHDEHGVNIHFGKRRGETE